METELIYSAINLTAFGMGFVFVFLTLLVFSVKFMSFIINKNQQPKNKDDNSGVNEIDEETKFIIEQAIKMHRGA
jgi:oxaloacetate decarboxylase gamma subunit